MNRLQLNSEGFGDEILDRFEIVIFTPIINRWKTNNEDSALSRVESMVGKIDFEFIDYEKDFRMVIKDSEDYQYLMNRYKDEINFVKTHKKTIFFTFVITFLQRLALFSIIGKSPPTLFLIIYISTINV